MPCNSCKEFHVTLSSTAHHLYAFVNSWEGWRCVGLTGRGCPTFHPPPSSFYASTEHTLNQTVRCTCNAYTAPAAAITAKHMRWQTRTNTSTSLLSGVFHAYVRPWILMCFAVTQYLFLFVKIVGSAWWFCCHSLFQFSWGCFCCWELLSFSFLHFLFSRHWFYVGLYPYQKG